MYPPLLNCSIRTFWRGCFAASDVFGAVAGDAAVVVVVVVAGADAAAAGVMPGAGVIAVASAGLVAGAGFVVVV